MIQGGQMAGRMVSKRKAKEILKHGAVRGRRLSKGQRGYFGAKASGTKMRKK
jgi:hypothetical protein